MENKKVQIEMYNSADEKVKVLFEIKPMKNRWEFTEIVSEAKAKAGNNEFKLTQEIAKGLFPKMLVSPKFELVKKISEDVSMTIDQQIKEYFINDPQKLSQVTQMLMGFMIRD